MTRYASEPGSALIKAVSGTKAVLLPLLLFL